MVSNLLRVRTSIPPLVTKTLPRAGILDKLNQNLTVSEGFTRQLTLLSAPAGYGKTTTVRRWLSGQEQVTAWYSIDKEDNEPEVFWTYLVSALNCLGSGLGDGSLEILRSRLMLSGPKVGDTVLAPLLNDLFELERPVYLVLDDYHHISNPDIHDHMAFFIDNLPPGIHLVATTRSDPPWPLFRWRAKGKMNELRLNDLRFSEQEAGQFLASLRGIELSDTQLNTLYEKTEGWATGLQLAAFSLSTSRSADAFLADFLSGHRHVFSFLSGEVFSRQPEQVQQFLLRTSILTRFNASLCNAVVGNTSSESLLGTLERDNLFVIPLDLQGVWYRYHPLFADLLLYQLKRISPEIVDELHARAAQWFLQAGEPAEAVRHALLGNSMDQVGSILHVHYEDILRVQGPKALNECLARFSPDMLRDYPRLAVHKALFCLIYEGMEAARVYLDLAGELSYANAHEQEAFAGMRAAVKTYFHVYSNQFTEALESAGVALSYLPPKSYYWRMNVAIYLGDAMLFSGKPKEAHKYYLEADRNAQKLGSSFMTLTTGFKVATSLNYLGRSWEAEETIKNTLNLAREKGLARVPRVGLLWALLGEILRERGELDEAERCIERGLFFSESEKPSLGWNYLHRVALSISCQDYEKAMEAVREIDALDVQAHLPRFILMPATIWKARILFATGESGGAKEALSGAGLIDSGAISAGQEWGYLTLVRGLLGGKECEPRVLRKLLNQVEVVATENEYKKLLLEVLLLRAWLEEEVSSPDSADSYLMSALHLGKETGSVQAFLDSGAQLVSIFRRLMDNLSQKASRLENDKTFLAYATSIGRSLLPEGEHVLLLREVIAEKPGERLSDHSIVDELTPRELELLNLVSEGLSNEDISKELFLSLGTVKWHLTNVYGKLGVRKRTEAVAVARKLNLLV